MNKSKDKAKKSKQRKILIISAMLAVLIIVGGTFAWFTSKDEVTNRLTASNTYGVSILESFSAPENWTPGQVVNKDVKVVNTGNVDAFVKATISSTLDLTVKGDSITVAAAWTAAQNDPTKLASCVTLSADEVKSLQAGGVLVRDGKGLVDKDKQVQGTDYTPTATGLYIFDRNDNTNDSERYVGYYCVKDTDGKLNYYKLDKIEVTKDADTGALKAIDASKVTLVTTKTVKGTVGTTDNFKYDYTNVNGTDSDSGKYIKVTYTAGTDATTDDVVIKINLASDWATYWTLDQTTNTFYYNNRIAAGDTSKLLIDSLKLDESVTKDAYIDFQYDLTINSDSVQVVTEEDGEQTATSVPNDWYVPTLTYESGEGADTNKIASIAWTKKTQASETTNNNEEASTEAESD